MRERHLRANLVRASGQQLAFYETQPIPMRQRAVFRQRVLRAFLIAQAHAHLFLIRRFDDVIVHRARLAAEFAKRDAVIVFFDLARANLIVDDVHRRFGLGGDHDAAGEAIDAVAQRGRKRALIHRIILTLLIQIRLNVGQQGVYLFGRVRMRHQSGALIRD